MKIAICDDDKQELSRILTMLEQYQSTQNAPLTFYPFSNSLELAAATRKDRYDLYLLDIIMPEMTGMELAQEIRSFDKNAGLIFLTTSAEFAVQSYTVKANNYLLKPVDPQQLFQTLDDIRKAKRQDEGQSILLKSSIGVHKVALNNVMYVEAQGRKVIYYLSNGEQITCTDRFSTVSEKLLPHSEFILAHRSFLVNMNYIRFIGSTDMQLQDGSILPLAQRRVTEIKKHYLAFQMEDTP